VVFERKKASQSDKVKGMLGLLMTRLRDNQGPANHVSLCHYQHHLCVQRKKKHPF